LLLFPFLVRSQVINPVPDMVFKGSLSAGRSTATDNSAYMSIGPARGANKGLMVPMVSDTSVVVQPRRHGLLIFSLQRDGFLYWDSTAVRWRQFSAVSVDTLTISTRAWRQKGIDSVASIARVTSVFSGLGMKFDTIKTSGAVSVDTIIMGTRARVQKGVDSLSSIKQDKLTLTTLGTAGPATLAGSVLNIPNYSPGTGFIRNIAAIGSVPNANGMSKFGDTLRLQPASATFGGVVTIGNQTFSGEKIFNERIRVGVSGGATIQNTNQFSVGIGNNALSSSLSSVSNNTAIGYNAGQSNVAGLNNVYIGSGAGDLRSTGQPNINSIGSVFVGVDSRPAGDNQANQIVIGNASRGNGSNTTTIGNLSTTKTYLLGTLNVSNIDSLAPTTSILFSNGGDVVRSGMVPVSFIDTSVIGTRAWRQKGIDSLSSAKQNKLKLSTVGNSGSSTLVSDSLNVPTYTLSGLGGVPTNRFLTINGVSYDLSADRTWTISAGTGTVTSVAAGLGMNFPTITTTGTVSADTFVLSTRSRVQKIADSVSSLISGGGLGTVTSVAAGFGTSFPTITNSGSVIVDSSVMATRARVLKQVDSVNAINASGTGISGYITKWTGSKTMDTSQIFQLGNKVGIGTTSPLYYLDIPYVSSGDYARIGGLVISRDGNGPVLDPTDRPITIRGQGNAGYIYGSTFSGVARWGINTTSVDNNMLTVSGSVSIGSDSAGIAGPTNGIKIQGRAKIHTIDSTSTARNILYQDLDGTIKKSSVPAGGSVDSTVYSTRAWRQKGIDSVVNLISSAGGGTVLSVSSGTGMNFSTITSSGSVSADTVILATRARAQKAVDSLGAIKQNNISLTTTGSSGASTFNGTTLNVPNYTLAGLGGVPTTRTLTINGTSYDLSADRSWTISGSGSGTVTSVAAGTGMNFSTITTTGTVNADTLSLSTRAWRQKGIDSVVNLIASSGGGTVLSVSAGTGMNFSTITSSGSVSADTSVLATRPRVQKAVDSLSAVKQNNLTLTTTGSSGSSTLVNSTLNVPTYTLSGLGGVPTSRNLTINGTTYDLSADRAWNILAGTGTVTSVAAGTGMNFSTITNTGTVSADTVALSTRAWRQKGVDSLNSIKQNNISLTTTGSSGASTFGSNTLNIPNYTLAGLGGVPTSRTLTINGTQFDLSSDRSWTISAGTGTVTSVTGGFGLTGGTITTSGTLALDTSSMATRARVQKGIDSVAALPRITGTGVSGYMARWTGASTQDTSRLFQSGNLVGINTTSPTERLDVDGKVRVRTIDSSASPINMLWADASGVLRKTAVPAGVTSVATGYGLSGGTITTTGTLVADSNLLSTRLWRQKGVDSVMSIVNQKPFGSGTLNYVAKWTPNGNTVGNSQIFDNGTNVGIGTTSPEAKLQVMSSPSFSGSNGNMGVNSTVDLGTIGAGSSFSSGKVWSGFSSFIKYNFSGSSTVQEGANLQGLFGTKRIAFSNAGTITMSPSAGGGKRVMAAITAFTQTESSASGGEVSDGAGLFVHGVYPVAGTQSTTFTNYYGLLINDLYDFNDGDQPVSITNRWGVYQAGASDKNYFAGNTGIGTTSPSEKLHVSGRVRVATIDSTASAINMLYADANGVIKKAAVPSGGSGADMDSTSLTIASGWNFGRDLTTANSINELVKTNKGNIMTITLQAVVYKTTATFSTGSWVTVATVPSGWRPNHTVYGSLPNLVTGTEYENISGTDFADDAFYEGACAYRILTNGNVQVRVDTVTSSATLSGANYVIFPIHIVYIVQFIPV